MSSFSIANLFGGKPAPSAPAQQPMQQSMQTNPGNIPPEAQNNMQSVQTQQTASNGTIPQNPAPQDPPKEGLDQYKDLWNLEPNPNAANPNAPLFDVSQEKIMEAAKKQNFTNNISQDTLAKMAAGGQEGVTAMMEVIQQATQAAYAQSAFATTKLIEAGLKQGGYARISEIDSKVKALSLNETLRSDNPLFSNPAVQPMLDMVQGQLLQKFPNATSAELKTMSQDFLTSFAGAITAPQLQQQQQQQQAQVAAGEMDWSKFLG